MIFRYLRKRIGFAIEYRTTYAEGPSSNQFLVSFDVESLFTNIPIYETITIILNKLFPSDDARYYGFRFNRSEFKTLLELIICQ